MREKAASAMRSRGALRRTRRGAAILALLAGLLAAAEARAQAANCGAPTACSQDLLVNFSSFYQASGGGNGNAAGAAVLAANAALEGRIYLGSTSAQKDLAVVNGPTAIPNVIYAIWNMTDPRLGTAFNAGSPLAPGGNAAPASYQAILLDVTMASVKTYFNSFATYLQAYGGITGDIYNQNGNLIGSARPFQSQTAVYANPWTTATASAMAVTAQQNAAQYSSWAQLAGTPSFPSGNSEIGHGVALLSAVLTPQYYKDLLLSGVEYAYSRNVFGAHYPIDAIAGRIFATYSVAQSLNGTNGYGPISTDALAQASAALQAYLGSGGSSPYAAACAGNVVGCIRAGAIPSAAQFAQDRATYTWYLTYGLPNYGPTDLPAVVPAGAQVLLATRFPYLTADQRTEVLATTEIASGAALDNGSGWARLNLYAAADGFGALNCGGAGASGCIQRVEMNAALGGYNAFDVWANPMTGTGGLTLAGTGTLVLAGTNSYSGGTIVAGGTLALTGTLAGAVAVAPGATFYNAGAVTAATGTVVTNNGMLINDGMINSPLINTGTAINGGTIRGAVANSGTLLNSGSITGAVATSGLLAGTGAIGGTLSVLPGGTVAPGAGMGTLAVGGAVAFAPGSTYAVEVGPGSASGLIAAAGAASVAGGALQVQVAPGTVIGLHSFTILSAAGGVSGQFAAVNDPFGAAYPFLDLALVSGPTTLSVQSTRSSVPLASVAQTANQAAVAGALDTVPATGPLVDAIVSLNAATAPAAFTALSGEIYASAQSVMLTQSAYVRDALDARLRQAAGTPGAVATGPATASLPPGLSATVWSEAYGGWGYGSGGTGVADVSTSIGGVFMGVDAPVGDSGRLGLAGGYGQSRFSAGALAASGSSDTYTLALYGSRAFGPLALRFGAGATWQDVSVSRTVAFQGFTNGLSSAYSGVTGQAFAEAGYSLPLAWAQLEPFANLAYVALHTDPLTETGGAAALTATAANQDTTVSTLGLRAAKTVAVGEGLWTAAVGVGWQHAFGAVTPVSSLSFVAGGAPYAVTGIPFARDAARLGLDLDFAARGNVTLGVHYVGQFAAEGQDNAIKGRVAITF